MTRKLALLILLLACLGGCSETPITLPLRSLERSGDVAFVCISYNADGTVSGRDINECPDIEGGTRELLALVTQTQRGEVAVINLSRGEVVDTDHSVPGFGFLPVGANPVDIVATPGGIASFVSVSEPGREGIFAIPSSCAGAPRLKPDGQPEHVRDLTSWPACYLGTRPGDIEVLVDPVNSAGEQRLSCDSAYSADAGASGVSAAAQRGECPADLALEQTPNGRRKLAVALPEYGAVAIIDAQELLDREPGSFDTCRVERMIPLQVQLPPAGVEQRVPADLTAPGCTPPLLNYGPPQQSFVPKPAGFELSSGKLYVADRSAPVVHVLDVSDPCASTELPPLLPVSYEERGRVVTTTKVAVSPLTTQGKRYAYAIDEKRGGVMVFDVSDDSSDRTPLLRKGAPFLPFEPPDRIQYGSPAQDVSFALRDVPRADPATGVAVVGQYCDPDPASNGPGVAYRPSSDFSRGASPRELRGVFGFIALASGQVAVVDLEDFDAACRRPVSSSSSSSEANFRGCIDGPNAPENFQLSDGTPTVTNEVSCNMVEPHRARSAVLALNRSDIGIRAPTLRNFPRLNVPDQGTVRNDQSESGKLYPKLLAVDFPKPGGGSDPAQVYVSNTLFVRGAEENNLVIDPNEADQNSVALRFEQPRAFVPEEEFSLTYEGPVTGTRRAGAVALGANQLTDASGSFCASGVEDVALARERAQKLGLSAAESDAFATSHADYVQVIDDFPAEDSSYWQVGYGATCGGVEPGFSRDVCLTEFGTPAEPAENRDFRILEAYQSKLSIEPRYAEGANKQRLMGLLNCCFPARFAYTVRAAEQWVLRGSASGFRHNVSADQSLRCVRDCNPRRSLLNARAYETSACPGAGAPVAPGGAGAACIFENLAMRFAVYPGAQPSARDFVFNFVANGGFVPLFASITSQTSSVSPQSMEFVPQIGQLAVCDGAAAGLGFVSLDSVSVSRLYF